MATDFLNVPSITIPEANWEETGEYLDEGDKRSRLLAAIKVNDVFMHLEAYEVTPNSVEQNIVDTEVDAALPKITGFDAFPLSETIIAGRRYVLIATPFGD